MKTTVDSERGTRGSDAVMTLNEEDDRRQRSERLAEQLGTFEGVITREELTKLRSAG